LARTEEGLRRTCSTCVDVNETGVGFRQTSQYSRDLNELPPGGEKLWSRFNGGKEGALWYYRALVNVFGGGKRIQPLVEEIDRVLTELESLANAGRRVTSRLSGRSQTYSHLAGGRG